jgi:chromosome segregation ATPase
MADLDPLGFGGRIGKLGESAAREIADALLEAPAFTQTIANALGLGEQAQVAGKQALGALNISSRDDLERLERRLRAAVDRLDEIEDRLDEIADHLAALRRERQSQGS